MQKSFHFFLCEVNLGALFKLNELLYNSLKSSDFSVLSVVKKQSLISVGESVELSLQILPGSTEGEIMKKKELKESF